MPKKRPVRKWFPLWIDEWLFGSTRQELIVFRNGELVDFRGLLIDLFALSRKDREGEGYIRANVGFPYPIDRLAGLLGMAAHPEYVEEAIELCIKHGKLIRHLDGTLQVASYEKYELSPKQTGRLDEEFDSEDVSASGLRDTMSLKRTSCPSKGTSIISSFLLSSKVKIKNKRREEEWEALVAAVEQGVREGKIKMSDLYELKARDRIHFLVSRRRFWGISPEEIKEWQGIYRAINVTDHLERMRGWLIAHPDRLKHDYPKFIDGWLGRNNETAKGFGPAGSPRPGDPGSWAARKAEEEARKGGPKK